MAEVRNFFFSPSAGAVPGAAESWMGVREESGGRKMLKLFRRRPDMALDLVAQYDGWAAFGYFRGS